MKNRIILILISLFYGCTMKLTTNIPSDEMEWTGKVELTVSSQRLSTAGTKKARLLYVVDFQSIKQEGGEANMMLKLKAEHRDVIQMMKKGNDVTIDSTFETFFYKNSQNKIDSIWSNPTFNIFMKREMVLLWMQNEAWYNKGNFIGDIAVQLNTTVPAGGVAYTGQINNKAASIVVVCGRKGISNLPWQTKMNFSNTFDLIGRYTIAHELGHLFGSKHTHWCGWIFPSGRIGRIDSCFNGEGTCGSSMKKSTIGTIMSYCGSNGGFGVGPEFGTLPTTAIQNGFNRSTRFPGSFLAGVSLRIDTLPSKRYVITTLINFNSAATIGRLFENGIQVRAFTVGSNAMARKDTFTSRPGNFTYFSSIEGNEQIHKSDSVLVKGITNIPGHTFSYIGTAYKPGTITANPLNATDESDATRWLTTGPATIIKTYTGPTRVTELIMKSGFDGTKPNRTLILTVDGINIPLNYIPTINFVKPLNITGKAFTITTTGESNISRILKVDIK